ncbi:putative cell cycle sequence binding phosphoprotein (RBP45) [Trypanosoma conorhini]|uniref:Putative cell cycle sequence binding phosphoprotein (RBP45) n=1 Tax=Trypanosoma conorhini TaxID=83891 RepID=A0A3R7KJ82_9TRYP|nr:putative cell cycle sequence binding phosphoprotein (RBP45) [Trypanosoma conorhini]RNF08643.1 putative cell cycle sequence binding phosphoprotein (RBP45) [Trypanosoma conorhini]
MTSEKADGLAMSVAILDEIEATRRLVDVYYFRQLTQLHAARSTFTQHFDQLARFLNAGASSRQEGADAVTLDAALTTPSRPKCIKDETTMVSPSMASPPVNRATLHDNHFLTEVGGESLAAWQGGPGGEWGAGARARPTLDSIPEERRSLSPPQDRSLPCKVIVVFKRKRFALLESQTYVAPGEYVVVGGDRGEDIGLVKHSWALDECDHNGDKKWGEGASSVLRVASALEVSQLNNVQAELEERAVEVAQNKVEEHGLPMLIVDAEYQFDMKKLTFYYQSQQRLDFRTLVRDLYKTFRARIWMEADVPS